LSNGQVELARDRFERSAELSKALDLPAVGARALQLLGVARLEMGDLRGARAALAKGVPAIVDIGDRLAIPAGLSALAGLAAKEGRPRAALALAGAAAEYEHVNHTYRAQAIRAYLDTWLVPVRSSVGAAAAKLLDEGRRMTLDEAIALGLDDRPEDRWRAGASPGLTRREAEVAALVARPDQPPDRRPAVPLGQDRRTDQQVMARLGRKCFMRATLARQVVVGRWEWLACVLACGG
jgi:hypothetical protein